MAGRRPGPAPKAPEARQRTNVDAVVGRDGWTEIAPEPFDGNVPPIPEWVAVTPMAEAVYAELAKLPQAALWGPGTWTQLHLTLPLLDRYLSRPGSESFKAIVATLGSALRLTEDDMQRARVRVTNPAEAGAENEPAQPAGVTSIKSRRSRLAG